LPIAVLVGYSLNYLPESLQNLGRIGKILIKVIPFFSENVIKMANLDVVIPHNLTQDEATERIKKLLAEIKRKHGDRISDLKENWEGNVGDFSFTSQGFSVSGNLEVSSSDVKLTGKIPLALSLFKGLISKTIYDEGSKILS
jgi:hypothetical protein